MPATRHVPQLFRELRRVFFISVGLLIFGTIGYLLIDPDHTGPFEALYMTVITLTTTGFSEYDGITAPARVFTLVLLVFGYGVMALIIARMTELFVIGSIFRDRRIQKLIRTMHNHVIIAGFGRIGQRVAYDMAAAGMPVLVIERSPELRDRIDELGYAAMVGDATDEDILREAGIERARGLIACLESDADNLFLTLSARELNPKLRIVSRSESQKTASKISRAGADRVISPYESGAMQMANALIRPAMLDFVEVVSGRGTLSLAMEEFIIRDDAEWAGWSLRTAPVRQQFDVIVIAIKQPDGTVQYNPPSETKLVPGAALICVGKPAQVEALKDKIGR